ncbi:MAG TPA: DUF177 domain-containing protein [Clostridiales bacterium]|nr:DUF177 domain-containing protein [Clostridiales bacterium]
MTMMIKVGKLKNVDGSAMPIGFSLNKEELHKDSSLKLAEGDLVFTGTVANRDRVITVSGEIRCVLQGSCDRCGEKVAIPMDVAFHESFTNLSEKCGDDEAEEEGVHLFSGDEIELLPYVEQAVFLSLPMKTLCREDCRGLCPVCGTNLNEKTCSCDKSPIDPRLAVLADLLNKG